MQKHRILIIDDEEASSYFMSQTLRKSGYEVMEVRSGNEGLLLARENFSLIILDVKLPDMNGKEVAKHLKASPHTVDIPVLQTSAAFTQPSDYADGIESGADAYLLQPIDPNVLLSTVKALLRLKSAESDARLKRQAEYELDKFFALSFDLLCICDGDLNFLKLSVARHDFLGYPEQEYRTLSLLALLRPEQTRSFAAVIETLKRGEETEVCLDVLSFEGSYVESTWKFLRDESSDRIFCVARDASFFSESKAKLQKLEAESDLLIKKAHVPFCVINSAGKYLKVNEAFATMTGFTVSELTGSGFPDLTCAEDFKLNKEGIRTLSLGIKDELYLEKRLVRKDGELLRVTEFLSVLERDPLRIGILVKQL